MSIYGKREITEAIDRIRPEYANRVHDNLVDELKNYQYDGTYADEHGHPCHDLVYRPDRDAVNHPSHYGNGTYEAINVIDAWNLGFCLGNAVKYIARAGKKDPEKRIEDLEKAIWYIQHEIERESDERLQ